MATENLMAENYTTLLPLPEKLNEAPVVSVVELELSDSEDERTFHDTDSAYVLPNE